MASLKLVKIIENLMLIKESENLDSVRMTSLEGHATESLTVLSHASGSITQTRRDVTMAYLCRYYRELGSGVPKSLEYLFGDDFNQKFQTITKTSKTIIINLSSNANTDKTRNKKQVKQETLS